MIYNEILRLKLCQTLQHQPISSPILQICFLKIPQLDLVGLKVVMGTRDRMLKLCLVMYSKRLASVLLAVCRAHSLSISYYAPK